MEGAAKEPEEPEEPPVEDAGEDAGEDAVEVQEGPEREPSVSSLEGDHDL